jgi:4-amino-4-deoxy-L-arabinose transferase-like glycosyltransferase
MIKERTRKRVQHQDWVTVVVLSLLVILLRLPSLEQPFDNDSGAIAYHARLIVRGEPLYGAHHPAHHLPAVYYTYALAFLLFGDSVWSVKFLLIPWIIAAVCLLYCLGALLIDRAVGLLAAVFYAILSSGIWLSGNTAEIELFANLPRIAAVLVMMRLTAQDASAWKFVFVGLLSAAAFLFKAVYLSPLALAGFVLLVELWQTRTTAGVWRAIVMRALWIGVGFAAGLSSVMAYFALEGLLSRFLLTFALGQEYVSFRNSDTLGHGHLSVALPLIGLGRSNAMLLVCSLAGFLVTILNEIRRHRHRRTREVSTPFYVSVWYILSFVEATVTQDFFLHYYLLIVPSLALLAAWFLLKLHRDLRESSRVASVSLPAILLVAALLVSAVRNFDYYCLYVQYRLGLRTYEDFLLDGWTGIGPGLVRVQKLADYVQEHTSPTDYIYYWSGGVQLYYLADRRCPIDMIWPLYVEVTGPHQRIFTPHTKYVIVGNSNNVPRPDWLYTELAEEGHTLETIIEGQEIYRRTN